MFEVVYPKPFSPLPDGWRDAYPQRGERIVLLRVPYGDSGAGVGDEVTVDWAEPMANAWGYGGHPYGMTIGAITDEGRKLSIGPNDYRRVVPRLTAAAQKARLHA